MTSSTDNPNKQIPSNRRILSYRLSTTLKDEELSNVSGGGNDRGTSRGTGRATYSQYGGKDAEADVEYDF